MDIKKGPWTVTGTEIKYKNPWLEVSEDAVIRPDGKTGIYGVVKMKAGASVLPYDSDGNVYLTQEYHYAVERVTIETISGALDGEESTLEAAKRELKEETGFTAERWTDLGSVDPFTSVILSPNHMYLAQNLTKGDSAQEGTETIKLLKVPFKDALDWALSGQITHAASVSAILKTARILQK